MCGNLNEMSLTMDKGIIVRNPTIGPQTIFIFIRKELDKLFFFIYCGLSLKKLITHLTNHKRYGIYLIKIVFP